MREYFGFVDPSGGSSDSMTLAVAHCGLLGKAILDGTLKSYGIQSITGDRYSGEWVRESFREQGVDYVVSDRTKSEIFLEALALFNSGRVRIPGDKRLRTQFLTLERHHGRSGRDVMDHPPSAGSHDDVANCAAGALLLAHEGSTEPQRLLCEFISMVPPEPKVTSGKPMTPEEQAAYQRWEDSFFDGSRSGGTGALQWGRKRGSFE